MALDAGQLATLKAAVAAEPSLATAVATGGDYEIAAWLNAPASPAFYLWRSDYTSAAIREAITAGITQLDALTASKRESLLWWAEAPQDMTDAATRTAINDLTGSQNTLKNAVLDGGKRAATVAEKLLATTGAGADGAFATPATPTFQGTVSAQEASLLR